VADLLADLPADIRVSGLALVHPGGHVALAGVDLTVSAGEVVALVGSNGAGKSTLLRCLVGLQRPTAGEVRIGGLAVTTAGRAELLRLRAGVGFVFQRLNLVPRLSVFATVLHGTISRRGLRGAWPALAGAQERSDAMACLDRVGIAAVAARPVGTLSGGQQQRVAIARMLVQRPTLVLADEPVASLDPSSGAAVLALLREIADEQGLTVLMALHQLPYARRYADRIVGLRGGRCELDTASSACTAGELDRLYASA